MKVLASAVVAALTLSGCSTTSISEIRTREVQDNVFVAGKSAQQVRDCLIEALGRERTPLDTGTPERRELTFSTPQAGATFFYVLTPRDNGVQVEARRKNTIADGFDEGRTCYKG